MLGFQPAVIGAAEFVEGSEFDHGIFLKLNFRCHLDMRLPLVHK
jgi:hypothetical protein